MKKRQYLLLCMLALLTTFNSYGQKKIAGYFPDYRLGQVDSVQWYKLSDAIFAFINADINGNLIAVAGDAVFGFNSLAFSQVQLKCTQNHVNLQIAVGGADVNYQRAQRLRDISRNPTALSNFATQIVNFCITNNLTGIDLDWEFPNEINGGVGGNTTDHKNMVIAIRNAINASSNTKLTISGTVGGEYTGIINHLAYIDNTTIPYMDYLHVMSYDLPVAYDPNDHSPLTAAQLGLDAYANKAGGYSKVMLGVPFYGRRNYDRYTDDSYMYKNLSANNLPAAYTSDNVGTDYYNGITTINSKIDYLVSKGSPGIFVWDIGQDRFDQYSLLSEIKTKVSSTCPITDPNLGPDQGICSGFITLNSGVSTASGLTFTWQLNGNNVVTNSPTQNTYTTSVGGVYTVIAAQSSCQKQSIINVIAGSSLTINQVSRCGVGTVTSTVNQTGGTYDWYNLSVGGTKLYTGQSYTSSVTGNVTYYVQQNTGSASYVGGLTSMSTSQLNSAQNEAAVSTNNLPRWANKVTVATDLTINSVLLYLPNVALSNASLFVISVVDGLTIVKTSTGVNIPAGGANGVAYTLPVNLQLTPGTYYVGLRIPGANGGGTWPNLLAGAYSLPTTNYPTSVTGIFTISGQSFANYSYGFNASTTPSTNYGQLFDWNISTGVASPCGRTPAIITVNAGADITRTITTVSPICPNTDGSVTVVASETNVLYQAVLGGINVGSPVSGNGSNILLDIPSANLLGGNNNITVIATRSGCGASVLTTTGVIYVNPFPNVSYTTSTSSSLCQGNNAIISLSGSQSGLIYQPYLGTTPVGNTVLGTGSGIQLTALVTNLGVGQNLITINITNPPCAAVNNLNIATVNITALTVPTLTLLGYNSVYGAAQFTVAPTSNSAGAYTYSILGNSTVASINSTSGQVTINGAGRATIAVSQAANACFAAATSTSILTIAKKLLSVTANAQTKTYGTANPTLTLSYNGFIGSDNANSLDILPTVTTTAVTLSPVGTYPIAAFGGLDNNYTFTFTGGTLTVTKATPTLSVTSANIGQAGSTINLTASTNSTGVVTWSVVSGNGAIVGSTITLTGSGSVTIQANLAADANYIAATAQQTITISAQTVPTITYTNISKTYGNAPFSATASSNSSGALTYSILSGSTFAAINSNTGTVTILGAGTVTLQVSQSPNGTFAAGTQTATLAIAKASLSASANNMSRPYNTANPTFTVNYSGFVGTDNASVLDIQPTASTSATQISNAGLYTISVSGGTDNNYMFSYVTGTLTVTQIAPTLNITSANVGQSGTSIGLTAASNSTGAITWSIVSGNGTVSGSNLLLGASGTVSIQANLSADINYIASTALQTVTITSQSVPTITFANVNKTYGNAPFNAAASSNSAGALTYSIVSGNAFAAINASTGTVTILGAGTVTLQVSQAANGPYAATSKTATLTINKATLTATANNASRPYNTSNPTFTVAYSGFVGTDNAASLTVQPTASTSATPSSSVGTYAIVPSGGSSNNYGFTYVNGTLTITSVNPSLSITSTNSGQAGGTINLTANTNSTGAVTWTVVSGNGSISGSTLYLLAQGSVTVQANLAPDPNFNAATTQQSITITPQTQPTVLFANFSATYGDPDFTVSVNSNSPGTITYSITSGSAFATINPTTGVVHITGAGSVTVQVSQAAYGTFAASSTTATLTINKANRSVTVTSANSAQAGTTLALSGNTNPTGGTITWSIQSQSGTNASISGSNLLAGNSPGSLVLVANVAADANFNATTITQTMNISTLATPTIGFPDIAKTFGDPAFNATATSNSTGALTYSITNGNSLATIDPNSGLVTILGAGQVTLQVSQAANGPYAATSQTANLTINKAMRTLTITSVNNGAVNGSVSLTAQVTPTATVFWSVSNATGAASVNGSTLSLLLVGTVTVNANVSADANYLAATSSQTFTIGAVTGIGGALGSQKLGLSVTPNPFESSAEVLVTLPSDAIVSLEVINTMGVTVEKLLNSTQLNEGDHSVQLNGSLQSGTYIIKLTANDQVTFSRIVKQ